jgi:hypothetical protein
LVWGEYRWPAGEASKATSSTDDCEACRSFCCPLKVFLILRAPGCVASSLGCIIRRRRRIELTMLRHNENLFDLADWLTDPPSGGPLQMWAVGAVLSAIVSGYGFLCCVTQHATTIGLTTRSRSLSQGLWVEISGVHAVTYGLVLISIGLFIHFQWFWGNHRRLGQFYELAKYAAVVAVILALVVHVGTMIART